MKKNSNVKVIGAALAVVLLGAALLAANPHQPVEKRIHHPQPPQG